MLLLGRFSRFCKALLSLLTVLTWIFSCITRTLSLTGCFDCSLVLLNVWHALHQDYCLSSWQAHILSLDTSHAHTRPSAASLTMNPASRHWFTNPCSSSQRGQPCKGVRLFVLRETWWKKLWFICLEFVPQDRMRKQMDKSYLVTGCDGVLAFLLAWPVL